MGKRVEVPQSVDSVLAIVRAVIVNVASGSCTEGPDGSGVNGSTPGPCDSSADRCRQARVLPEVTRAPSPSIGIHSVTDGLRSGAESMET